MGIKQKTEVNFLTPITVPIADSRGSVINFSISSGSEIILFVWIITKCMLTLGSKL